MHPHPVRRPVPTFPLHGTWLKVRRTPRRPAAPRFAGRARPMTDLVLPERNADAIDALLARVAGGDRAAFEALYRDAAPLLLGICLRVLPDRAEAEDVLQDVFV